MKFQLSSSLENNLSTYPAFISVGSLDNFVDECIDYAQRLMQSGVPTDLQFIRGVCGSVGMVPHSPISIGGPKLKRCTSSGVLPE